MKKRNKKILSVVLALSLTLSFTINPFITNAYAATVSETQNIDIKLESADNTSSAANNFTLTNKGETVNLSKVKIRYYFTSNEDANGQAFSCYYACISGLNDKYKSLTDSVHGSFVKLDNPVENADSYLEISFDENAGTFDSSDVLTINTAINNNNWSKVNSNDDYSFNNSSKTVVLIDNEVVYGTAPASNKEEIPKITIGGGTVKGGETINIPVNISNIKKKGISKFHIKASYDPNVFEFDKCLIHSPEINKLGYNVKIGEGINEYEHTIDIGYDFTKSKDTTALYEEGDYVNIPLKALSTAEDGTSKLEIITEPTLTDADGKEYSGNSITVDNKPITVKYNKDVVKNSSISQNYLTFDESSLKDIDITMKNYENTVASIECSLDDCDTYTLNSDTDFNISDNTLTLKDNFLKTLIDKNAFITINFSQGLSQTIFINNSKLNTASDPLRSGINNDEANVSFASYYTSSIKAKSPLTFAVTNTSNIDINLNKLFIELYYEKDDYEFEDNFNQIYCSILGSNKDMRSVSLPFCSGTSCPHFTDTCYLENEFTKGAGMLKPGETLLIRGCFLENKGKDTLRKAIGTPVVLYNWESLYGEKAEDFRGGSSIISDDIILDSSERDNTLIKLNLNSNALKSIDAYSESNFIKTLEKGTDYILNKRDEIILTKSYLDSIDKNTTLSLKFSYGNNANINIKTNTSNENLPEGTLTIENKASTGIGLIHSYFGPPEWHKLCVPVTVKDTADENIKSHVLMLKFDKDLFENVEVSHSNYFDHYDKPIHINKINKNPISSAEVNYELGIIKITLLNNKIHDTSTDTGADFNLIFTPNWNLCAQKINLSLDSDSYYETESGDKYKPVFNYNDIELVTKEDLR